MRKQDYLVSLITSLSANEKRYFKLFCNLQPGEKRYLKLFDVLEKQQKYDAVLLSKQLNVKPRQLADDKLYLTQTLLQSLRNYDQESSEITKLRSNKESVQTLINRRRFDFAIDLLNKTLERTLELEVFEMVNSLLLLRSICYQNVNLLPPTNNTLLLHQRYGAILTEIITLTELRGYARYLDSTGAKAKAFEKIVQHPLIQAKANQLKSLRAKSLRFETLSHYYSTLPDDNKLLKSALEERNLYLKNPIIKTINPIVYLTNISRIAASETNFEVREKYVWLMQKELQNPEIKISKQRRDSMLWSTYSMSLWNLRHLHRFKDALHLAHRSYIQSENRSEYDRFTITFEYALILLHNNKIHEAVEITDELLRYKSDVRLNLQPHARLLYIMAQLAMQHFSILPAVIKAARFWFKKTNTGNAEIDLLLKHAGLIAKAPVGKRIVWQDLLHLIEQNKLPTLKQQLQLDVWVKQMISKTSMY